jgi:tryptophanyl-tRNA synthetase
MSKSDPEETFVALLDKPDFIRRKIRRAVTDSENSVRFDPETKPGVSNLMSILSALTGTSLDGIAAEYAGKGYGAFKDAVADAVVATLEPIQTEYDRIVADKEYLQSVMTEGAERAGALAHKTMLKMRKKLGLAPIKL